MEGIFNQCWKAIMDRPCQLNSVYMKTLQLLLLLTAVSLFSCNKDEEQDDVADYKVLGITSVTVNGQEFQIKNEVLLDVADTQSIAADGVLVRSMEAQVTYVVLIAKGVTPSVVVKSSYAGCFLCLFGAGFMCACKHKHE